MSKEILSSGGSKLRRQMVRENESIDSMVGRKMRAARIANGFTLQDVAGKLDVSVSQVQRYETGRARIGAECLWRLTGLLNRPVDYFFDAKKTAKSTQQIDGHDALRSKLLSAYDKITDTAYREVLVDLARQFSRR